jgi:hypothetical protein
MIGMFGGARASGDCAPLTSYHDFARNLRCDTRAESGLPAETARVRASCLPG